jgi:enoyl-[acyl-carrier protein] reductase/trans-2-enoyl-CoA reductase (NAD+)
MCITAHPSGCDANVKEQIDYVKKQKVFSGPKRVLVIGSSTGYGLAARITAAFGGNASTIGVFFEKSGGEKKTASAGWYNSAAFHKYASLENLYCKSINGDAFSDEIKQKVIETIKADLGQIDLVVYSLASPRRQHPKTGEIFNSVLKPIGKDVKLRGINTDKEEIQEFNLSAASEEDIAQTVAVMGGEDWSFWIKSLSEAGVLSESFLTSAFTYVGEKATWDLYWKGTIGRAKQDLDKKVDDINKILIPIGGKAKVSVLKAVVTQASSAIPIMPLYLSLLFKAMKDAGTHEGCIEQLYRLYTECLYSETPRMDESGRLRVDDLEINPAIQDGLANAWAKVTTENLHELTDFKGYKDEFIKLFGFGINEINYDAEVEPLIEIKNLL